MSVNPTGPISLVLASARSLLANCAAFKTWVSAGDAVAAAESVYLFDIPPAADGQEYDAAQMIALRPFARIGLFVSHRGYGGEPILSIRVGDTAYLDTSRLMIDFEANVVAEDSPADSAMRFVNDLGAIIADLGLNSGETSFLTSDEITAGLGGLALQRIEIYQGPFRADQTQIQTVGDHWRGQLLVHCGM